MCGGPSVVVFNFWVPYNWLNTLKGVPSKHGCFLAETWDSSELRSWSTIKDMLRARDFQTLNQDQLVLLL
jgi:hypothetical protein